MAVTWYAITCSPNPTTVKDIEGSKPVVVAENTDAPPAIKPTLDNVCLTKDATQKKQPTNNPASLVFVQPFIMYTVPKAMQSKLLVSRPHPC